MSTTLTLSQIAQAERLYFRWSVSRDEMEMFSAQMPDPELVIREEITRPLLTELSLMMALDPEEIGGRDLTVTRMEHPEHPIGALITFTGQWSPTSLEAELTGATHVDGTRLALQRVMQQLEIPQPASPSRWDPVTADEMSAHLTVDVYQLTGYRLPERVWVYSYTSSRPYP